MFIIEVLQLLVAVIGVVAAFWAGAIAFKNWREGRLLSRASFLGELIEKFDNDEIRQMICSFDSPRGAHRYFENIGDPKNMAVVDRTLKLLSYLVYLKEHQLIANDEMIMLKTQLDNVIADDDIQDFLQYEKERHDTASSPYLHLIKYSEKNLKIKHENSAGRDSTCLLSEIGLPLMVIKINRLYREGMSPDEILEVTRKWWRIDKTVADKVKIILAVSDGKIKAVFDKVGEWRKDDSGKFNGRYELTTADYNNALSEKFNGQSVSHLFPKGAANPIRYFGMDRI